MCIEVIVCNISVDFLIHSVVTIIVNKTKCCGRVAMHDIIAGLGA